MAETFTAAVRRRLGEHQPVCPTCGQPAGQSLERAGGIHQALMLHHPHHGGQARDLADVVAYRESIEPR